jgi:S-DNA-T family DNA segregation ATPase FtsK/SpoIIIE
VAAAGAGTHLLLAGVTESGKSSVLWSLLRGLAPAIRDGTVVVWVLDPKGGMELGPGEALFARFCAEDFEAMADMLDEAVAVMQARTRRCRQTGTRLHVPTREEPLILVVIDEVATLTAYQPDAKLRTRMARSVGLLLSQGRGPGVSVLAALQDPRKEVLGLRDLFPTRVALQLDEADQVDMVLGPGARDQGALCDKIPDSTRGVAYNAHRGRPATGPGSAPPTSTTSTSRRWRPCTRPRRRPAPGSAPSWKGAAASSSSPPSSRPRSTRSAPAGMSGVSRHDRYVAGGDGGRHGAVHGLRARAPGRGAGRAAGTIVHAWLADPAGETCHYCGAGDESEAAR